ncbi:hypothetical protein FB480_11759 [Agrobacterium vitis]|nr:hypothetical protein FB480_11759 [Agrobacterium vitis]
MFNPLTLTKAALVYLAARRTFMLLTKQIHLSTLQQDQYD